METIEFEDNEGGGIIITPSDGLYDSVLFWFHGLGDTAHGWADAIEYLNIPKTKLILPNAPNRPITLNFGHSMPGWSDIYGLKSDDPEDIEGFTNSMNRINLLIDKEVNDNNILPSRIIIGGFSQGGALALHISLRHQKYSFGGCIAFSTWLPFHADYPSSLSNYATSLPIFQAHGTSDNIVPYKWGHSSHNLLKTFISSPSPIFLSIPNMAHSSHPRELEECKQFILERLKNE